MGVLLDSDAVDAVLVVLPPKPGLELALRALRKGKHCLQEKPIGTSEEKILTALKEYEEMGSSRPVWGLAENYRYESAFEISRELIEEKLGSVTAMSLNASLALSNTSAYWHTPWRHSVTDLPTVG